MLVQCLTEAAEAIKRSIWFIELIVVVSSVNWENKVEEYGDKGERKPSLT